MQDNSELNVNLDAKHKYFSDSSFRDLLQIASNKLVVDNADGTESASISSEIRRFLIESLGCMAKNVKLFDDACLFNIEALGQEFKKCIEGADLLNAADLQKLAGYTYRFIIEFQVVYSAELPDSLSIALHNYRACEKGVVATNHFEFAQHSMLIAVLKKYLHHKDLVSIRELPSLLDRSKRNTEEAKVDLQRRISEVDKLKKALDKQKTAFNFVLLNMGFRSMRFKKSLEKHFNFFGLLVLGGALISPAVAKIYFYYTKYELPSIDLYTALSVAALELLFVFFFRVALHNFRAVKAQILQLDLRIALIQFVQDYSKYMKENKDAGGASLERFEQIIFSGIVSGESDLPSTFDGIDGIAKIIEKLKMKP